MTTCPWPCVILADCMVAKPPSKTYMARPYQQKPGKASWSLLAITGLFFLPPSSSVWFSFVCRPACQRRVVQLRSNGDLASQRLHSGLKASSLPSFRPPGGPKASYSDADGLPMASVLLILWPRCGLSTVPGPLDGLAVALLCQ